ncbi:proliferation marker protein Ki-67 [Equus przewalskii]|uniref:Proliferation marker protein Ki-67 n=1 Tax=Equus przewalskii TaxID=9798 RepID=A0ABM4JYR0_EQUPR
MGSTGRLVTIKRSGVDGPHFPLSLRTCLFGRGVECDIRIQLPVVSKQHCKIEINKQEAILFNFSTTNPTRVNGSTFDKPVQLKHGDVITIVDRSFRYENENESHQNGNESTEFPGPRREQGSLRRGSRSSFSSDPDGKVQDSDARSKLTEESVSARALVHVKNVEAADTVSDDSEDHVARKTPTVLHSSGLPGDNCRNAMDPPPGDLKEDSSVTLVSRNGEVKSVPSTQCLRKSENNDSPFRKLYESMKEELDGKSEKENVLWSRRKSGSQSHCPTENKSAGGLQGGTRVLVSLKSRPKSGGSTQIKADPVSAEQGSSQTEEKTTDEEPVQTPQETTSPSGPHLETPGTKTPAQPSHRSSSRRRPSEDRSVSQGSESVNPGQREGFRADNKTFTPRRSLTRNQTPTNVENAGNFGNTPEKLFSKKRKSLPTNVDVLTTETEIQNQTILAPLLVQVEGKIQNDALHKPEKLDTAAGQTRSGSPDLSSVDVGKFGDSINKVEGMSLKRRRVSFGGHLRPELFDENLPPNTPLKRGETPMKRRSLATHTPTVLKKIIKEQSQPSRKEDSPSKIHLEVTTQNVVKSSPAQNPTKTSPVANDQRRTSSKASSVSSGSKSPCQTDTPKRGGRRSSSLPSKRMSTDRSQHEILQMIYSKRRSGASEANLIVAKSWADVVKLGAKQTQTKVVKRGPQRQLNKRQKRINTPKKPTGSVHNQFSTGHANSPCTIVIGKAHIEKVNVPARPYRMLNNFVFNKKMDFNEDLSGLTEMFKTPAKERPQRRSVCPITFSNSEDLLGKKFQVPNSEENPLLCASENFGESMFPSTQNAPKELSDKISASPASSKQQNMKVNEDMEKTPRNMHKMTGAEMKTPVSEAEPMQAVASANTSRRSVGLRNRLTPGTEGKNQEMETGTTGNILGRRLRKTPLQEQKLEGEMQESERSFEMCKKIIESKENSEKMVAVRRSRRSSELKWEPTADLTALKKLHEREPKDDLLDIHSVLQTPDQAVKPVDVEHITTKMRRKSPKPEPANTPTRTNIRLQTPPHKVDGEGLSALSKATQTPGEITHTHREPVDDEKSIKLFKETAEQEVDPAANVTGSKRRPRTPKGKTPPLEDLAGFRELFQTPVHAKEPMTDDKTTKILYQSPQPEPVIVSTRMSRRLKTPLRKVDVEEELSALRKPTQTPGESSLSHKEPVGAVSEEAPEQKLDPAENVTGSKRRTGTPKKKICSLEDLLGFTELFQTPDHTKEPVTDDQTTKISCKSPQAEPVDTPTSRKRSLKTPPQRADTEKELSALRKPMQTPGETVHTHGGPVDEDKDIKLLKQTPKLRLDSEKNETGSKRLPRKPKEKAQPLEDLDGLKMLFQTPDHTKEPVTEEKTTRIPCKSPQAEPVNTPTSRRRQPRAPPQKVEEQEHLSAGKMPTQALGETTCSHGEPVDDGKDIRAFKETAEQELDPAANVTGSKRRPRTPKGKTPPLEDLAGFRELFQTPVHIKEPMTDDKTTKMLYQSPQPEPVIVSTSMSRRLKTPLWKVDVEEELSALRKPTQTPGESSLSHKEPVGDDKGIAVSEEAPEQKLDPAENVTGSKRQTRTPRKDTQHSLEDLLGFTELFQTPDHAKEPMTDDQTTKISCKSPQAEPVDTPTSRRRSLKTPSQKVDTQKELSALRKPMQTPGETVHTHRGPVDDDKDIRLLKETPKLRLDSEENVTGGKRLPRKPKEKAQPLEDLDGLKMLFQTPDHTKEPVTEKKTTRTPCKSPQAEPVNTPTSGRRKLRPPPQKVEEQEHLSAGKMPTQALGETTCSHGEPVDDGKDIRAFKETAEQELDPAANVTGSKRRPRTPKGKTPPLEDLAGFRELFQTPVHAKEQMTDDKTTKILYQSPQPELVIVSTRMSRRLKTPLRKVDVEEELSALRKPTQTPGESSLSHKEPVGDDKGIAVSEEAPEQKLDPAENVTGSKRQTRTPRKDTQHSLEDLLGFTELFQTPDHAKEPMTDDQTTKISRKSPQAEPVDTPTSRRRSLKTPSQKVDTEKELSALRKPMQTPGETVHTHRGPVDDDKDIRLFKETPKLRLDSEENVTGGKRLPRKPKEKAQPLEDLDGLKMLFQTPDHTKEPVTEEKTTRIPCKSPQAEPVNIPTSRKRQPRAPPQKVNEKEDRSARRKPTQTLGRTTRSRREPVSGDKDSKVFEETARQEQGPPASVTGSKRQPRRAKEKAQPLEDLDGLTDVIQTPDHTEHEIKMTEDKTTKMPCKSLQVEPVMVPTGRKRRLRAPAQKVDVEDELSARRKPTQTPGEITHTYGQPAGDDKDIKVFKETPRQELDPEENVTRSKKQPRIPKKKAQPLEDLNGLEELIQMPDHTDEPMTEDKTTKMLGKSPQVELVMAPPSKKRRLRVPPQNVDEQEVPSAGRKPTQTLGRTTRSRRGPVDGDKDIKVFEETARRELDPTASVTGNKRQLRIPKEKAQPLEDLARYKEVLQMPAHAKKLGTDAETIKVTPTQTPDRREPVKMSRRVLRARKTKPMDDLVGTREPVQSQRGSRVSPSPKRKGGKHGSVTGRKRLRSVTTPPEMAEEKPLQKKQRTAPGETLTPSEPSIAEKRILRILAKRIEPVEELPSNTKTEKKGQRVEDATAPNKGMSLRSRRPNKTTVEEQRTEFLISAEKIKIKRNEKKPMNTSQEMKLQNPEDGAKNSTSGGQVHESRMGLRSGRQNKMPLPNVAEEKVRKKRVEIHVESQKEKEATGHSDSKSLRSRKITIPPKGNTLEGESEQRVTRRANRRAETTKTDNDNVCIKKIRTRSRRDNEDV